MGSIPPIPDAVFGDWGKQTDVEDEKLPSGPEIIVQAEPEPSIPTPEFQRPVEPPANEVEKEESMVEEERVVEKERLVEEEIEERIVEEERVVKKEKEELSPLFRR